MMLGEGVLGQKRGLKTPGEVFGKPQNAPSSFCSRRRRFDSRILSKNFVKLQSLVEFEIEIIHFVEEKHSKSLKNQENIEKLSHNNAIEIDKSKSEIDPRNGKKLM